MRCGREHVEISQEDLKLLLEQVRDLTSRVHRLEELLRIVPPAQAPVATSGPPGQSTTASSISTSSQQTPKAPPSTTTPVPLAAPAFRALTSSGDTADLESRIGSHWLNRIGIAAVLIGVSYFLKYAFENNWIGPSGRIAIGLIAGIAVVLWSENFRSRGYRIFSFSLKAVGIGVLYLSLWAAFQVYHLMPSEVVFACMLVVTCATCAMALTQDAEILAVYSIVGGFATPLLLSTGVNREIALFSYVTLLDLGIL